MQIIYYKVIAYDDRSKHKGHDGYLDKLRSWIPGAYFKKPAQAEHLFPRSLPRLSLTGTTLPVTAHLPDYNAVTGEEIPVTTLLAYLTKHSEVSAELKADMLKLFARNQRIFGPVLDRLKTGDHYHLPFSMVRHSEDGWRTKGRSLFYSVQLDGHDFDIVFKNINPVATANPITIKPEFMFEPVQTSHVLRFGGNRVDSQAAIINSLAVASVLETAGAQPNTMIPLGIYNLTDGMMAKLPQTDGTFSEATVDTFTYFQQLTNQMSPLEKINFLKFLLTDMPRYQQGSDILPVISEAENYLKAFPTKKNSEFAQINWPAMTARDEQQVSLLIEKLLKVWTPVLLVYAVEGHGDERLNWLSSDGQGHKKSTLASASIVLRSYGIEEGSSSDTVTERKKIALGFAQELARIGYYHLVGGDFGSWSGSIHGKDITVSGAIMDLDAAGLPGTFEISNAYVNLTYALVYSIPEFCWALGFDEDEIIKQCRELFKDKYTQIILNHDEQQHLAKYRSDKMSEADYTRYLNKLVKYIVDK